MYITCVCGIQHQIIDFNIKFGKSVRSMFVGLQGLPAARGWEAPWAAHAPGVALRHPWANAKGRRGARDSGMLRSDGSFQASGHKMRRKEKDMEGVAD